MTGNATAIIGATRNSALFSAPWTTSTALPADTVLYGTTWGSTWVDRGFTQEGIELGITVDRSEIMVDQQLDPVLMPITSRDVSLKSNLAQMNANNLLLGTGQGAITTTAAASGVRGHDDYDLAATVSDSYSSWGIDIQNDGDTEAVRIFVPKGIAIGGPSLKFGDPAHNAKIPIEIRALPDTGRSPVAILKVRDIIPALP